MKKATNSDIEGGGSKICYFLVMSFLKTPLGIVGNSISTPNF